MVTIVVVASNGYGSSLTTTTEVRGGWVGMMVLNQVFARGLLPLTTIISAQERTYHSLLRPALRQFNWSHLEVPILVGKNRFTYDWDILFVRTIVDNFLILPTL